MKWRTEKIKNLGVVQTGTTPRTSDKENFGDYISFIKPADFSPNGKLNYSNQKLSEIGLQKTRLIKSNSVLMVCIGATIGKVGFSTIDVTTNQQINSITPDSSCDTKFIYYQMSTQNFQKKVKANAGQATLPIINKTKWSNLTLKVPPLEEQKRIVEILDESFAQIEKAEAIARQNLTNARELFDSYLNKLLSEFPTDKYVALSELSISITDGDHQPPPKANEGIPFITISNIDKNFRKIDFRETFKVPEEYFKKLKNNRKPVKGDVLYTVTGSYGIPVIVENDNLFCFQRHIGLIRPKPDTNSRFLYYLLLSSLVKKQADKSATGTAQKTVGLRALRKFTVPKISLDKQLDIVEKLNYFDKNSTRLENIYQRKLEALGELKQSILQKAFTGQLTQ